MRADTERQPTGKTGGKKTSGEAGQCLAQHVQAGRLRLVPNRQIKFVGLIGAPEGVSRLSEAHPSLDIYLAAVDRQLNAVGYIVPGLGDAGDRQFRT